MIKNLTKYQSQALSVLRIVTAFLFLQHGTSKFFEFPISMTGGNGSVQLFSIYGLAGILEIVFGVLLLIGLFTRLSAFILSGQMAVAYFFFHTTVSNFLLPLLNGGESAVLFCFIFLYLVFAGGGVWSVDHSRNIE